MVKVIISIVGSIFVVACSESSITASRNTGIQEGKNSKNEIGNTGKKIEVNTSQTPLELATGTFPITVLEFLNSQSNRSNDSASENVDISPEEFGTWQSSNEVSASLNDINLEAKAAGTVTITRTFNGTSNQRQLVINPIKVKVYQGANPISGNFIDFGSIRTSDNKATVIQIENSGELPFEVSKIRIIGNDKEDFILSGKLPKLNPSNRGSIEIAFNPKTAGVKIATLVIECLVEDTNGEKKSALLLANSLIGFAHFKFVEIEGGAIVTNINFKPPMTLFGARDGKVYMGFNGHGTKRLIDVLWDNLGGGTYDITSDHFAISPWNVRSGFEKTILYPNYFINQYEGEKVIYKISRPCMSLYPTPKILDAFDDLESSIDTDFGFLITVNSRKPKEISCGITEPRITDFYPIRSTYSYYTMDAKFPDQLFPYGSVSGRLYPAFCLNELCYFRHVNLDGGVKILSNSFQPVLEDLGITDVLGQAKLKDRAIILVKLKDHSQPVSQLKIFSIVLNPEGRLNSTEVPWPEQYKNVLESKSIGTVIAAGDSTIGLLIENSFLILREKSGKIEVNMKHPDIASEMLTGDARRSGAGLYEMDNSFDANKTKLLFRIGGDFLLRKGGSFYAISTRDPNANFFPVEVPVNAKFPNSSVVVPYNSIVSDRTDNSIYMLVGKLFGSESVVKFSR